MNEEDRDSEDEWDLPDELLLEEARRSHAAMTSELYALDRKSASLFNVTAILIGLMVVSGVLSLGRAFEIEKGNVSLYIASAFLGAALLFAFASLLNSLRAWERFEVSLPDPSGLTSEYEDTTATVLRHDLIIELSDEVAVMGLGQDDLASHLETAFKLLRISIISLFIYIIFLLAVLVT